jgi:membrane protease YdiL (CAAX protease family)
LLAVVSTSLLYAATHFFARFTILPADVGSGSGVDLVLGSLRAFAAPAQMADAYLCLAAVGVLLALVRRQTGNIAAGIGLHAGWVTLMLVTLRTTERNPDAASAWLLSEHDGFVGWLTLAWTLLAAIPVLRYYRRQHPQSPPSTG